MPDNYSKINDPTASGGFFGTGVGTNDILQGAQGPKGDTGDQGVQGVQGDQGIQGIQGDQGIQGNQGVAGTDGTDGTNGTDGTGWTSGSYNASNGVVTFVSDDGLGFVTGDLRSGTQAFLSETCKNVSGGSLVIGTPVYQSGTSGNAMEVQAARADTAGSMSSVGLLGSTLADAAEGTLILTGILQGVNTSSFSEGDTLYIAATGGLTNTVPTGSGNLIQNIGRVVKVHASNGSIMVTGAGRANATPNLDNGDIFIGNGFNQAITSSLSTEVQTVGDSRYLQDSEVTNLALVKAFSSSDYATAAQGTLATNALPKAGGALTGPVTTTSTFDGRDVSVDGLKLDGIEAGATNTIGNATHTGEVTGSGALTIADNVVDEANLKVSNTPTDGYFLSAQSGNTGGLTWATVPAGYTDSDVDTHLNTSTATTGEVLSWSGTDYDWIAAGGSPDLFAENYDGTSTLPSATGANAVAIGDSATATSDDDVAIGVNANATASGSSPSLALGRDANATSGGIAIGNFTDATGTYGTAIGTSADATAINASALGNDAQAAGSDAVALGKSRASGSYSLAAAIANNTSSYGATGANSIAMGQKSKATGGQSAAIGNFAQATNTSACAIGGYLPRAEGTSSLALGTYAQAEAAGSVAIGYRTKSKTTGKLAFNAAEPTGGVGTNNGDNQRGMYVLRRATTDATQTVLSGNGGTVAASNSWVPEDNSAHAFSGTIIARQDATDGDDYAAWEVKGAIMRASNASSTVVGMAIINSLYHTSGASAWDVAIEANTTLGSCEVKVTGAASTNIQWVATIDTSEVVNA